MKPYQKRRVVYAVGTAVSLFLILSVLTDAAWVFRVFLVLKNRKIALDTNRDGRVDYVEYWENGQLQKAEWDLNYDGTVDYRNEYLHGIVSRLELDADYDGRFEYREILDDNRYIYEKDENGDGVFVEIGRSPTVTLESPNPR